MADEQQPKQRKENPSRFKKGKPPGPGRPKGKLNKATIEIRKFTQGLFRGLFKDPAYKKALRDRIMRGKEHPANIALLLAYGYGKPPEKITIEDPEGVLGGGGQIRRDELVKQLCNRFAAIVTEGRAREAAQPALDGGAGGPILELEGHCEAEPDLAGRRVDDLADSGGTRLGQDQNGS